MSPVEDGTSSSVRLTPQQSEKRLQHRHEDGDGADLQCGAVGWTPLAVVPTNWPWSAHCQGWGSHLPSGLHSGPAMSSLLRWRWAASRPEWRAVRADLVSCATKIATFPQNGGKLRGALEARASNDKVFTHKPLGSKFSTTKCLHISG